MSRQSSARPAMSLSIPKNSTFKRTSPVSLSDGGRPLFVASGWKPEFSPRGPLALLSRQARHFSMSRSIAAVWVKVRALLCSSRRQNTLHHILVGGRAIVAHDGEWAIGGQVPLADQPIGHGGQGDKYQTDGNSSDGKRRNSPDKRAWSTR